MNDTIENLKITLDTLSFGVSNPIYVVDKTLHSFNYWTLIPYIVSILSIIFVVYDRTLKSKIFGKIISITTSIQAKFKYTDYKGNSKILEGQGLLLKISIGVYKKDLSFSDINIYANYDSSKKMKGEIYWTNKEILKMGDKEFDLVIPPNQFLTYNNFIEKNKVLFFYVKFIVPNKFDSEQLTSIEIDFIHPNKKTQSILFPLINEKQIFFDPEIHIEK